MIEFLFADQDRMEDAYRMFRLALSTIGVGLILIGLVMFFYRPKEEAKQSTRAARLAALISFSVLGVGTIVYAWTLFGR